MKASEGRMLCQMKVRKKSVDLDMGCAHIENWRRYTRLDVGIPRWEIRYRRPKSHYFYN